MRLGGPREDYVRLGAALPQGWVELPTDPAVGPQAWATANVAEAAAGLEPTEHSIGEEAAAAQLASFVQRAQEAAVPGLSAHVALAFQPDPLGQVLVFASATVFPFEDGPLTVPGLLETLGAGPETVGQRHVQELDLALGRAVRLRRMFGAGAAAGVPVGGPGVDDVMEGITYVALPRGLDGFVWFDALWVDLVLGDDLAAVVDELAAALRLDARQGRGR
ncbi:hypothetical protein [Nocardioides pantholopis]|uniref:hypothetical protein n=1 Tax=Nocardioides pantholopis TaxID=2483798 RepID=UPI000FDA4CFD|nr:hypothetical protein [Nocardioides pantholopis]